MNKILVTGGAGYIGSVLVGVLLNNGFKVRVLDRFMFGGESLLPLINNKNLEIIAGDVRDKKILKKTLNDVFAVIHLAALVGEPACRENPTVTKEINFQATKNLITMSKSFGVSRFIFTSTCSNYGVSSQDEQATEKSKLNPLSLYAKTKIASEEFVLSAKSKSFHPTVLRLATVFGLSPKMRFNLMINLFAKEAAQNGEISIINPEAWRPFVHTLDASFAFLTVLNSPVSKINGKIFNVVSENIQKKDLVAIAKKYNPKIKILIEESSKKDDKRDYKVSSEKFRKITGWRSKVSVEEGFFEIFEAVKNNIFHNTEDFRYNAWFDDKIFLEKYI